MWKYRINPRGGLEICDDYGRLIMFMHNSGDWTSWEHYEDNRFLRWDGISSGGSYIKLWNR